MNQFSLENKTALVTGASRGIGQAIAIGLAQAGANVICTSSRHGGCEQTVNVIKDLGRSSWDIACDLSNREQSLMLLYEAENVSSSHVDILLNNAGTIKRHPAQAFPDDDWDQVIEVNLNSLFVICREFGKRLLERKQSGKIINIASLLSFSGGVTVPAYAASKHAVAGLTKALANEWAANDIQVNAIAPGYIETDNTAALRENKQRLEEISKRIPAGRWGKPEDLVGATVFLASSSSDYVNGHILTVDGGWMAR